MSEYYEVNCICGHTRAHHQVDEFQCDAEDCECPRFLCIADHPELLKIEGALADIYGGKLMDRDRMDMVTVQLKTETWRTIQAIWYKMQRTKGSH